MAVQGGTERPIVVPRGSQLEWTWNVVGKELVKCKEELMAAMQA
jgi:hypothetical protein